MTAIAEEEATLLERARGGDHEAFAGLIHAHQAMVFSLAWHFFGDRDRAADVAQDIFLQLYRNLSAVGSEAHLVHWLRQVTTRRCIDLARRTRLRAVPLESAAAVPVRGEVRDPLLGRALRDGVGALPESQRVIVTLRYQEDLDPSEISRIVGMPLATVKSHLYRALQSLRRKLETR